MTGEIREKVNKEIDKKKQLSSEKKDLKKINRIIKKSFLKTIVWNIALYDCETWVINEAEKRYLDAFSKCGVGGEWKKLARKIEPRMRRY